MWRWPRHNRIVRSIEQCSLMRMGKEYSELNGRPFARSLLQSLLIFMSLCLQSRHGSSEGIILLPPPPMLNPFSPNKPILHLPIWLPVSNGNEEDKAFPCLLSSPFGLTVYEEKDLLGYWHAILNIKHHLSSWQINFCQMKYNL